MGHYFRPHRPRRRQGRRPSAANKQSHHAAAKRSSHKVWPTPQPSQPTPHSQPTTAGGCWSSHRLLTRHPCPAATQPHQPHPTLPLAPSTLYAHSPHPIHRPCRGHLCNRPYPHHPPFCIPFQHPSLTTMAQPSPPAPHFAPHLPLPQLPLLQFSLHQAPLQSRPAPTLLPSTWPLLCWLHSYWHPPPRAQSPRQTQTTPKQHSHFCRTLLTLLAFTQQHPPLHHHSTYLP